MFWEIMASKAGGAPTGELAKDIDAAFGSFGKFQEKLSTAAVTRFGSGWGWLVLNKGKLEVISLPNQDSPLLKGQFPIMGIDVWEHAYLLAIQTKATGLRQSVVEYGELERHRRALRGREKTIVRCHLRFAPA